MVLCGLEIILYPQTVLFKRVAERVPFASESQVRERGSTREPLTAIVVETRARAGVQSKARAPGYTAYAHLGVDRRSRTRL
jgi:hypothetical protein